MRGFVRFLIRLAILALVVWAVRRYLEQPQGAPAAAMARSEPAVRARRAAESARRHVRRAVEEGRMAAANARRELEAAAGGAIGPAEEGRRPDDPEI